LRFAGIPRINAFTPFSAYFIASSTATAQATVAPTIGLLPSGAEEAAGESRTYQIPNCMM